MTPSNRMEFRLYPIFLLGGPKNIHTIRRAPRISEGGLGVNGLEFQVGGWQGGVLF